MTYSSTLAMNRQRSTNTWGKHQNSTRFSQAKSNLGPVSNTIMLLVLTCLLGLLYLTQVTKTNAYGYQVNDLQKKQANLQFEHDELEIASARLQSLERVKNSPVANSMVSVANAETVQN